MKRVTVSALAGLQVLATLFVFVVGRCVPQSVASRLEAREAELKARLPAQRDVPAGLQEPAVGNILPHDITLANALGHAPRVTSLADYDIEAQEAFAAKQAELVELRTLLRGTYASDRIILRTPELESWVVLRAYEERETCAEAIVDAARFLYARSITGNELQSYSSVETLAQLREAIAPCAARSDAATRERAAEALENLAEVRGIPTEVLRLATSVGDLQERSNDSLLPGFDGDIRQLFETSEAQLDVAEAAVRNPDQDWLRWAGSSSMARQTETSRVLGLRLFAAVFRAHGLEGQAATDAIASLQDLDGAPFAIDADVVRVAGESDAIADLSEVLRQIEIPPLDNSTDRTHIQSTIRRNIAAFRRCYERELEGEPFLEVRVNTRFVVTTDGSVQSASANAETSRPPLEACIVRGLQRLRFQERSGVSIVNYPFSFMPES
ncbi:MAG: AgmX/PglI C-terminal domain-containing protein [Myxococcota bacterium]